MSMDKPWISTFGHSWSVGAMSGSGVLRAAYRDGPAASLGPRPSLVNLKPAFIPRFSDCVYQSARCASSSKQLVSYKGVTELMVPWYQRCTF